MIIENLGVGVSAMYHTLIPYVLDLCIGEVGLTNGI